MTPTLCGRLLVGQGTDTWDPNCVLASGHAGPCKPATRSETKLYACACRVTDDEPGMVVCWVCEQPIATLDPNDLDQVCAANIIGKLTGRYEVGEAASS